MRIFFAGGGTGGHLYPALAIARALVRADAQVKPFFIGAKRGIERDVLPAAEFPFELLDLHPLYRSAPWRNWQTITGGLRAWRRIVTLARDDRPRALVATGGYVAGVASQYARTRGIPLVIQEQNSFPGMTVRWFAPYARQIHVGFPEAMRAVRAGARTQLFDSGNPIEPPPVPRPDRADALAQWGFSRTGTQPVLLIFGGSQGAQAINRVVAEWLAHDGVSTNGVRVIWITGKNAYDEYARFETPDVKVRAYVSPMTSAYAAVDMAVSRAGAMATAELLAWGVPMILVPLPTAAADHQTANAQALADAGAAVLVRQSALTVDALSGALQQLLHNPSNLDAMRVAALRRARPTAADDIARHILTIV